MYIIKLVSEEGTTNLKYLKSGLHQVFEETVHIHTEDMN